MFRGIYSECKITLGLNLERKVGRSPMSADLGDTEVE